MEPLTRSKIVSLKKQLNFEYAFRPIYTFSRITGLWPFSIIHDSKGEIYKPRVGFFDILRTVFIICLNLTLIFFQYKRFNQEKFETKLPFAVLSLFKISSLLTGTFGIVFDLINRNMLINILRKFNIFDNEISNFGVHFDYKREHRRGWLYLLAPTAISLFLFGSISLIVLHKKPLDMIRTLSVTFLHFVIWITYEVSFIIFIHNLSDRYSALNTLLRNRFLNGGSLKVSVNICKKDSIDVIKFVGRQHANLTEIMDQLNVCYSLQIMISITGTFAVSVFSMYAFCHYVLHPGANNAFVPCVFTISLMLHITGTLIIIYHSCKLTKEGRRTFRIVHDITNCCIDPEMMQSLNYLSHQTEDHHPVATCGLFKFDWTLLFNMIAATVTYLIIALNFERTQHKN